MNEEPITKFSEDSNQGDETGGIPNDGDPEKKPTSSTPQDQVVRSFPGGYVYQDKGKLGLLDQNYQILEEARYDKVEPFSGGAAVVHQNGKRGYVNIEGVEFIAPQYDLAWNYETDHEGLAKVRLKGRDFYINKQGNETSPPPTTRNRSQSKPQNVSLTREAAIREIESNMVRVEGGTFQMGSEKGRDDEKPVHSVTLSTFEIGKYPVTQRQWEAVMGNNPSRFNNCPECPVEKVSWEDAQKFIQQLNEYTAGGYRLPTEAEWEFAARGGNQSQGYAYAGSNDLDAVGWYWKNSGDKPLDGEWDWGKIEKNNSRIHPVGQKQPNALGIYDMSGNVWEWCQDWYDKYPSGPLKNPTGPESGPAPGAPRGQLVQPRFSLPGGVSRPQRPV